MSRSDVVTMVTVHAVIQALVAKQAMRAEYAQMVIEEARRCFLEDVAALDSDEDILF